MKQLWIDYVTLTRLDDLIDGRIWFSREEFPELLGCLELVLDWRGLKRCHHFRRDDSVWRRGQRRHAAHGDGIARFRRSGACNHFILNIKESSNNDTISLHFLSSQHSAWLISRQLRLENSFYRAKYFGNCALKINLKRRLLFLSSFEKN